LKVFGWKLSGFGRQKDQKNTKPSQNY